MSNGYSPSIFDDEKTVLEQLEEVKILLSEGTGTELQGSDTITLLEEDGETSINLEAGLVSDIMRSVKVPVNPVWSESVITIDRMDQNVLTLGQFVHKLPMYRHLIGIEGDEFVTDWYPFWIEIINASSIPIDDFQTLEEVVSESRNGIDFLGDGRIWIPCNVFRFLDDTQNYYSGSGWICFYEESGSQKAEFKGSLLAEVSYEQYQTLNIWIGGFEDTVVPLLG